MGFGVRHANQLLLLHVNGTLSEECMRAVCWAEEGAQSTPGEEFIQNVRGISEVPDTMY